MTYGTCTPSTELLLKSAGLHHALDFPAERPDEDDEDVTEDELIAYDEQYPSLDIDVFVAGALDEWFTVRAEFARDVVTVIADDLRSRSFDPASPLFGESWDVAAYVPGDVVDYVQRSGEA